MINKSHGIYKVQRCQNTLITYKKNEGISLYCELRQKKINYVSQAPPASPSTPRIKNFIAFPVFRLKIVYTSRIVSLGWPSFAAILFVDWLACILKVENFSGNYSDTSFYSISFNKIKNKRCPLHHFLKKMPEKHIINFFGLIC